MAAGNGADRGQSRSGRQEPRPRYSRGGSPPPPSPVSETVRVPLSVSGTPSPAGWSFELFPGVSFDAVAAAVPLPGLRPVAGAAPGVFSDFADAFSWAKGAVFDPIGSAVTGFASEIVKYATQAIGGFFSIAGWWVYKFFDGLLGSDTSIAWRSLFPHPDIIKGLSPWFYLHKVWAMVWKGTANVVESAGNWLWSQISTGFAAAGNLVWVVGDWVGAQVWNAGTWLSAQVWNAGDWLWSQISTGFTAAAGLAGDAADWLWAQTAAGFNTVVDQTSKAVIAGGQAIGELVFEGFKWLGNSIFEPFVDVVKGKLAIPNKLISGQYANALEFINDVLDPPEEMLKGWTGALLMPFLVVGLLVNMVTGLSGPLLEPLLQEQARNVGARIPPFAFLRDALLRGEMTEGVHDEWMGRFGYDAANIGLQKVLYQQIPGPSDLVRMGVREVFTPAIAERFGQFQDFPDAFGDWMEKQGYDRFWAQAFWGAHWDLPSPTQGFVMLHRGVIDEGELSLLLRALDVMPFWRDKLTQISYNPFTRVDVRRMYSAGVIERGEVERTYRALGYAPADAVTLTNWVIKAFPRKTDDPNTGLRGLSLATIKQAYARRLIDRETALENVIELDYAPDDADLIIANWEFEWTVDPGARSDLPLKELSATTIERAYERRLIDLNAGVTELTEMGYTPEDARLRFQLVDLGLEEQLANLQIDAALNDFENGLISEAQFAARLADINVPQGRIDFLLQRELLSREVKNQRLSLSQMKRALAAGFMTEDDYRARLDARGYNPVDVEILVALEVEAV